MKRMKKNDRPESRTLTAAVAASVLLHVTVIGGWVCWEKGSGVQGGSHRTPSMEIKVKIVPETQESPAAGGSQENRVRVRTSAAQAVSANRLLSDPSSGLIFSVYFKAVKAHLAREAASRGFAASQDVTVHFVVSRTGRIEAVSTPPGTPAGVQKAALDLLTAAAPFPPFPSSIRHSSIAFEVLFRCDRNVLR